MESERHNQLNPGSEEKKSYVEECFDSSPMPVVASTDYMRSYAEQIRPYIKEEFTVLGTDGFGRSDSRETLREFFEIDVNSIVRASVYSLYKNNKLDKTVLDKIYEEIGVDSSKINPWEA
jgi:pyruvate dehydrogenase E1 component